MVLPRHWGVLASWRQLVLLLIAALGAAGARGGEPPPTATEPPKAAAGAPRAFDAYTPAELEALVEKLAADHVIDVTPDYLVVEAMRARSALSYGEPKRVALVIDREGRVTDELDLAYSVGDEGVELSYEHLRVGLLRVTTTSFTCTPETRCQPHPSADTYRLNENGKLWLLIPFARYCDRASGEELELELVEDPGRPRAARITYRSRKNRAGRALELLSADPALTRLVVRFGKGRTTYELLLKDDYSSLTSKGSDATPRQTFLRGECEGASP